MPRPSLRFALSRGVVIALSLVLLVAGQGSAASTWSRVLADIGGVTGAAPGPSSGSYVATTTYASGIYRARLYRLSVSGGTVWTKTLSKGEYMGTGQILGLASDASGVYVSLMVKPWPQPLQYQVRKYDPAGNLKWKVGWSGIEEGDGGLIGVAGSTVYVAYHDATGRDLIRRYATNDGDQRSTWELALDARLYPMDLGGFVATTDGLYLASAGRLWDDVQIHLTKMALDGTPAWTRTVSRAGDDLRVGTLSADGSSVVLAYTVQDDTDIIRLVRYSPGGTKRWTGKAPGTYTPTGATSGSAAYSATLHYTKARSGQIIVSRYSSSGAIAKQREVGSAGYDTANRILVSGGYLYLFGATTKGGSDSRPLVMRVSAP